MNFKEFKKQFQDNFDKISKDETRLFEVELDRDELWDLYLDSFPDGTNELYKEKREYDCSCCRSFIKNVGNVVAIKDNKIVTVWDMELNCHTFQPVTKALSDYVKSKPIKGIWFADSKKIGVDSNRQILESGNVLKWEHFYLEVDNSFVDKYSAREINSQLTSGKDVFKRALEEITQDSIDSLLELISQKSLYKGEEWTWALTELAKHKIAYEDLSSDERDLYAWQKSMSNSPVVSRIRNSSIGTLLVDLSKGVELDIAVSKYEKIVAPENYKRPKPIFTKKMLEDAQKTISQLGLEDSLDRRYATIEDITVNNILFSNRDSAKKILGGGVFDDMLNDIAIKPKKYSKVEEISIENFVKDVLPSVKELEVLLEGRHSKNMVSLIAPKNKDSKSMFKWNNGFSWAYSGNITDSSMRENVKSAGGKVDGVLRFSIQWNDGSEYNANDFDAHCIEPNTNRIFFGRKRSSTGGELDVDIMHPRDGEVAVENITWGSKNSMEKGEYRFYVNNYSHRGGRDGFKAEIEFDGEVYSFDYNKDVKNKETVEIATVTLDSNGNFSINESIKSEQSSRDIWGVKTNQFIPVSVAMFSPNYWDEQIGVGNKHYMFMLKDCNNPERPNGSYNEFLKPELDKHRKVFEALNTKLRVDDSDKQLSGLGFSSTQRNDVVVRIKGNVERVLKIKF